MGDRLGSFSRVRMSEDKVCTKDPCWSVGTIYDPKELPGVSTASPGIGRGVTSTTVPVLHTCTPQADRHDCTTQNLTPRLVHDMTRDATR
jgi:hypothetical protein